VEETPTAGRAPAGDKPKGFVCRVVNIVADILAVNPRSRASRCDAAKAIRSPERAGSCPIRRQKKGDQVDTVHTEALAISVEAAVSK
jgi:hypothetical protein